MSIGWCSREFVLKIIPEKPPSQKLGGFFLLKFCPIYNYRQATEEKP